MKYILTITLILLTGILAWGDIDTFEGQATSGLSNIEGQEVAAGGCSCTNTWVSNTAATVGDYDLYDATNNKFLGQVFTGQSEIEICKVTWYLTDKAGDMTTLDFTSRVYSWSGGAMNTLLGSSTAVDGVEGWNDTAVEFDFSGSTVTVSGDFFVALQDDKGAASGSLYAEMEYTAGTEIIGSGHRCDELESTCADISQDFKVVITTCQ